MHQLTAAVFSIAVNGLLRIDKDNQWDKWTEKDIKTAVPRRSKLTVLGGCFLLLPLYLFQMYLFILATPLQLSSSPSASDCRETSSSRKWKDSIYLHNGSLNTCHVVMLLDLFTGRRHSMFGQKMSTGVKRGIMSAGELQDWAHMSFKIKSVGYKK